MKTIFGLIPGMILGASCICQAQNLANQTTQTILPATTPYAITRQDANSRVWQRTTYDNGPQGVVTNTHSYTELASGLNHWVNGQWVASSEQIDILPNGTAAATNGQHQAYFPGDIYNGQIELVTPDGLQLNSRPLALSYFDGTNTVVIAELTNSVGLVSGNNQVIYPNAFTGFKVDLRYTYTKAGFEQDIILRQQPPTPESLGLNPDTARLQILTEFFSPPQPTIQSTALPTQAGVSLTDETLGFGAMQMVPGRAFLMGANATDAGAMVSKHWVAVNGRQLLIEEVPVNAILEGLAALPLTAMNSTPSQKHTLMAAKHLKLPHQRLAHHNASKTMLMVKVEPLSKGFVLDYVTVSSSVTNYTFQGDTTYYISGTANLYGTNTLEGGTVIKYSASGSVSFNSINTVLNCATASYRPAVFTTMDDNSVGETISGSSGSPYPYNGATGLSFSEANPATLHNIRMSYLGLGINFAYETNNLVSDAQFIQCQQVMELVASDCKLFNALISGNHYVFDGSSTAWCQNVTFYSLDSFFYHSPVNLYLTNCLVVGVGNTNGVTGGGNNQFLSSAAGVFQTVGGGAFYLAASSPYRGAGTTNIDATLLASLKQKTTFPPILYSNVMVSVNTTLQPQAQRDFDAPDLGYHYDPIDYLVDDYTVTNAALTLTNGVAIACYNDGGIIPTDGSSINSLGSPLYPNWLVRYSSVQEQPVSLGPYAPSSAYMVNPYHLTSLQPTGYFRFTKFACPAGGGYHLYHYQPDWSYANLLVQDCEFWSGINYFGGNTNSVAILKNNLFARSTFSAIPYNSTSLSYLYLTNNSFWGLSAVTFGQHVNAPASTNWCVFNNDFDSCTNIGNTTVSITNGYNAYFNSSGYVYPTNATDLFTNLGLAFQTGPLGTFYQPGASPLINKGSTNANLLGLYYYTITTNEVIEGNSIVSIGYHYVALDSNGNPLATFNDGIPDYLDDIDGNRLPDWWEIANFGHTGVNPNADADGDGLGNSLEYQLGTNPNSPNSAIPSSFTIQTCPQ